MLNVQLRRFLRILLPLWLVGGTVSAGESDAAFTALAETDGLGIIKGQARYFRVDHGLWGPKWSWTSYRGTLTGEGDKSAAQLSATLDQTGATLHLQVETLRTGPEQFTLRYTLQAAQDTPLTLAIASLSLGTLFGQGAQVKTRSADGEILEKAMPLGITSFGDHVAHVTLEDKEGAKTEIDITPPAEVTADGSLRIVLAKDQLRVEQPRQLQLVIQLPGSVTYYASPSEVPEEPGWGEWFAWRPGQDQDQPSEIDMTDWLETPAGRHGRIRRQEDKLIYHDTPFKLWGINLCYAHCAPDKDLSEKRARTYAKYGINSVRLHKYADGPGWQGIQGPESFLEFDAAALDRMDYQVAQFKKAGIYTELSSTFGVKLGPKDGEHVPYLQEFGSLKNGQGRLATGHGSVFLSREIQDLQMQQMVKLLQHKNPYTGLTYAQDPAIAAVELFNEDSALFYGTLRILQTIPTLRQRASERFCDWLTAKYGNEEGLLAAWGKESLDAFANEGFTGENLGKKTIVPAGNPWFYDPVQLAGSQKVKRRRLLDTMLFFYEWQNEFYARYVETIRQTGYDGEILASNWQAGRAFSHYYNLHSDYQVGLIDRHNYFGGRDGGDIQNASMCRVPGSALLSSGMQQVANRPFMLSEWIHVFPTEWGVEGPAIIGAYAMGLQGWDVSYMFQNRDEGGFNSQLGRDQWEVMAPHVLGVFPAVARQVLRGDVSESDLLAKRYVHVPSLHEGRLGFEDRITQEHDFKTFDCRQVPHQALAVARCVVEFTENYTETPAFDLSPYVRDGLYRSSTGQLLWQEGTAKHEGFWTLDTPATKAVVGFASGQTLRLGDVTIKPASRFAAIYITAAEKDRDLSTSKKLLVVAVARARNTGMKILRDSRLLTTGTAPVLMEPVVATITIRREGTPRVTALNHDGCKTQVTVPVSDGSFTVDGARYQTVYYCIDY